MLELTSRRGSIELPVLGTAVLPSQPRYPRRRPGLAWVTADHARTGRARSRPLELVGGGAAGGSPPRLRRSPGGARAALPAGAASRSGPLLFETWEAQRDNALGDAQGTQVIVTIFTILLLIVAFVVVELVGARASEEHRQIGPRRRPGSRRARSESSSRSSPRCLAWSRPPWASRSSHPGAPPCRAQRGDAARHADDGRESLAHPRRRLGGGSRASAGALTSTRRRHSLQRPRGDPCGQPVSLELTPGSRRRRVRHAVDDQLGLSDLLERGRRALLRSRDRAHRRDGGRRGLSRRDARRAACLEDQ